MALLCGVEEAGRGPVIGPMVICGVLVDEKDLPKLRSLGAKDSKLLTPKTREILFEQIKALVRRYEAIIVSPKEIDEALASPDSNLNKLEAEKMAEAINRLKPDKVVLDCPSNNPRMYKADLVRHLKKKDIDIKAEHKAENKYTVVAAASIIAKVTRDSEIEKIKKKIGIDFGSGYPSDERTQEFLKRNWSKHSKIFRKSWASYKNILKGLSQSKLDQF